MPGIIDYVRTANDTFDERPPTAVDSLVLSWVANMRIPEEVPAASSLPGVTLTEIYLGTETVGLVAPLHDPKGSEALLSRCATSPRFSQLRACLAADEWSQRLEKQFSATTFLSPHGAFIAFRGTDDTLVGWKENFQMAYKDAIPAQEAARAYVERVAEQVEGPLWLGGHSKGGNLAIYAAMTCSEAVRSRIARVFSHDGPGFLEKTLQRSDWAGAYELVERTMPEESLFGVLFAHQDPEPRIVKSTSPGILSHSPFSWVVEGADFAAAGALSYDAHRNGKRINAWILRMSEHDRERFVEVFFKLIDSTGEVTLSGLGQSLADGSLQIMLRRLDGLPDSDRVFFLEAMGDLAATLLLGPAPTQPQTPKEHVDAAVDKVDDITAKFNDRLSKLDRFGQ